MKKITVSMFTICSLLSPIILSTPTQAIDNSIQLANQTKESLEVQLFEACKKGDILKVKHLVKKGADVKKRNDFDLTAMMVAALSGNLELIKFLEFQGLKLNEVGEYGNSALSGASSKGHLNIVKYILNKENVTLEELNSAMARAAFSGELNAMKFLISKGANQFHLPFFFAAEKGHLEIVKLLHEKHGVKINHRARPGEFLVRGSSALLVASNEGQQETIKYLISKGANVNLKNNPGDTPLIKASFRGHIEVIKYLVFNGALINVRNNKGQSALAVAKDEKTKKLLIQLGAKN